MAGKTVFEREGAEWNAMPAFSSFDQLPNLLWKHSRLSPDLTPERVTVCLCGWMIAEDAPNPTSPGWHRAHLAEVVAAYAEEEAGYALAAEKDRYDQLLAARADDIRFKLEYFEAWKATEAELASLRAKGDEL